MCGRYRLTRTDRLAERFEAIYGGAAEDLKPRYNIAPTRPVSVIRHTNSGRVISSMRWGLIPSWAKDASAGQINARSETLLEKPTFRENLERRRCLIPADGFYEWKRVGSSKQPFHFGMKDDSLFAFAGIWDSWRPRDGAVIESCAILTTTPNELLVDVHDRMPVILHPNHYHAWLTAPALKSNHFAHILAPFDASLMKKFPVSSLVNNVQIDGPECVAEVEESTSTQAALF